MTDKQSTDSRLEVRPEGKLRKDGSISHQGEGTRGNVTHGMETFMLRGDSALTKGQRERKTYLNDLMREAEGRAELFHQVTATLAFIVVEASDYLLAQDKPDKALNQLLNSNMRLLMQYLDKYPEDKKAAPAVIDALEKADRAVEKDWSVDR